MATRLARVAQIFPGWNKDPKPTKYYSSGLDVNFLSKGFGVQSSWTWWTLVAMTA